MVTLEILPGFTEPTGLSDTLPLFRYRRVEVSVQALYRRRRHGGTTASCGWRPRMAAPRHRCPWARSS